MAVKKSVKPSVQKSTRLRQTAAVKRSAAPKPNRTLPGVACQDAVLQASPYALVVADADGRVLFTNAKFRAATGLADSQWQGKRLQDLTKKKGSPPVLAQMLKTLKTRQGQRLEIHHDHAEGNGHWLLVQTTPVTDSRGRLTHVAGYEDDISEWRHAIELMEHMVLHDPLTNLPNRILFNRYLDESLEHARLAGQKLAAVLLDLDRFKLVNATLDHNVGDELIRAVGKRLREQLPTHDIIARMGGDEFMILLTGLGHFQEAFHRVQDIMQVFATPFDVGGRELHINCSMGVSLFPEDGQDPQSLLRNADSALHEAKNSGRNHYKFYTANLNANGLEQLAKETHIRRALDHHEFEVYYQPQVHFKTGRIVGVEALLRWNHPELGLMMPDQFIPLTEENGLIVPLGKWVLEEACAQTRKWHQAGYRDLRINVNLSVRQFREPEIVEMILGTCQAAGLDPKFLELEITETLLMKDEGVVQMILRWLNKKGVRISIDDFGTGYSSLAYLKRFPVTTLKIDRAFIRDCLANADDAAIVSTITAIAHNLGIAIVAEGVEEEGQFRFLDNLDCDEFQGTLFAAPLPAEEVTRLLAEGQPYVPPQPNPNEHL